MKHIAIYGAGGFGKETKFLLEAINRRTPQFIFEGFIDDSPKENIKKAELATFQAIAIAMASPESRRNVFERKIKKLGKLEFPNLIAPDVYLDMTVSLGKGNVICNGVKMTVDIRLGDFVIINLNATVGHDTRIGSFTSIMPSVNISGNVTIGEGVFIGSGATILQGLKIGDGAVVGAGAVVTRNVPAGVVAKGVPARWR